MNIVINLAIVLEITVVSFLLLNIYFHKKYASVRTISRFLTVLFSLLLYIAIILFFAIQIAQLCSISNQTLLVLAVQSGLYLVSIYWFIRFAKQKFLYFLTNMSVKITRYVQAINLLWLAFIILNFSFNHDHLWLRIIALIILTTGIGISYMVLFLLVKSSQDIQQLKKVIYIDEMTGLNNRSRMFMDAAAKINNKIPFHLLYIDLNDFKTVNDSYGHLAGDNYLCKIAEIMKGIIGKHGKLYRMSGDEFICLYTDENITGCLNKLNQYPWDDLLEGIDFLGFSIGYSMYPQDSAILDDLIFIADSRMYQQKRDGYDSCKNS